MLEILLGLILFLVLATIARPSYNSPPEPAADPMPPGSPPPPAAPKVTDSRTTELWILFDEAWQEGIRSYTGLIDYAKAKTGLGTSKAKVKAWKAARGLLNA